MALTRELMRELCDRLWPDARIASMGYPDIIAPLSDVEDVLYTKAKQLRMNEHSDNIRRLHGINHDIPDSHSFFDLLGAKLDVFDVVKRRGCEIIHDMNTPISVFHYTRYDFVLDVGTLEHCFNIGQAALNMASLLNKGGIILHENPFNWGNHGFYNINPTWYVDFYAQTGFKLIDLQMIARNCSNQGTNVGNVSVKNRFKYMQTEANMIAVAERTEILPIRFPMQGRYARKIAELQAAPAAGDVGRQAAAG